MNIIKSIQILLAILFISTTSITCTDYVGAKDSIQIVQFTAETKVPIIKVSIQGEDYIFLLDSQSPVSFIDSLVVIKKRLRVKNVTSEELVLVTGDTNNRTRAVSIMDNTFYVHNFKQTKANVKWHTGYSIDGIIGKDMLYNNRASLNLRKVILEKLNDKKQ